MNNGQFKKIINPNLNFILIAFLIIIFLVTILAPIYGVPNEDAAITFNYSRNLANTGIISYAPFGERAEGATAFGWMLLIAILQKFGIDNYLSTGFLNIFFMLFFGYRLFSIGKSLKYELDSQSIILGFSVFVGILFTTGISISALGGFETIAQISLLGIIFASFLFYKFDWLFISSSLFYILLRPDSIAYYLAIFVPFTLSNFLIAVYEKNNINKINLKKIFNLNSLKLFFKNKITFLPLLFFPIYWLFRALYFGYFFPLPFYVKKLYGANIGSYFYRLLRELIIVSNNNLSLIIVISIAILLSSNIFLNNEKNVIIKKDTINNTEIKNLWSKGIICWFFFYISQSLYLARFHLQQNIWDRFHSPLLAISAALASCFIMVHFGKLSNHISRRKLTLSLVAILFLISLNLSSNQGSTGFKRIALGYKDFFLNSKDNIYYLSRDLGELNKKLKIDKIFTTEAGRISYYSGIPTVDTWGLNTNKYAISPLQNPQDIIDQQPDLIAMHTNLRTVSEAYDNNIDPQELNVGRICVDKRNPEHLCGGLEMTQAIFFGALTANYKYYLIPYLNENKYQLWFINPKSKNSEELESLLISRKAIRIYDTNELNNYAW